MVEQRRQRFNCSLLPYVPMPIRCTVLPSTKYEFFACFSNRGNSVRPFGLSCWSLLFLRSHLSRASMSSAMSGSPHLRFFMFASVFGSPHEIISELKLITCAGLTHRRTPGAIVVEAQLYRQFFHASSSITGHGEVGEVSDRLGVVSRFQAPRLKSGHVFWT